MYTYNNMYEVKSAIEGYNRNCSGYKEKPAYWRAVHRQWDYIIGRVCTGCGKPLSRYDTLKGYAFCFHCRQILFPETVKAHKSYGKRFRHPRARGHSL